MQAAGLFAAPLCVSAVCFTSLKTKNNKIITKQKNTKRDGSGICTLVAACAVDCFLLLLGDS
jgi:hypothetical protein